MPRRLAAPLLAAAALASWGAAAGCRDEAEPAPSACFEEAQVAQALRAAPREVLLPDGTRLARCVELATSDAQLQDLGMVLTRVADRLGDDAARGDVGAATQLGFLIGAADRGARTTQGVQLELVRRLESVARRVEAGGAGAAAALQAAYRTGARTG